MLKKRTTNQSSQAIEKHLLTMRDLERDMYKFAENYDPPFNAILVIGGIAAVICLILTFAVPGKLKILFVLLLLAILGYAGFQLLNIRKQKYSYIEIGISLPKGNFSLMRDTVAHKYQTDMRGGIIKCPIYCLKTEDQEDPIEISAVCYQNAEEGDVVYLVRNGLKGTIINAYLDKQYHFEQDLIERIS